MKTVKIKIEIKRADFEFSAGEVKILIKWQLVGTKELNGVNYKEWSVGALVHNKGAVTGIDQFKYKTTLQPNVSNSKDFLDKIFKL